MAKTAHDAVVTKVISSSEETRNTDLMRSTKMTRSIATTLDIPLHFYTTTTDFILATSYNSYDMYLFS